MARKFSSAEVEITAKDNTRSGLKSAGDRVGSLTKIVKSYAAEIMAAYLIMKKVVAVLSDWVEESRAQEQAVMKLNTVLKSMGDYSYSTSQEMLDFASSMEQVTTFSDDVIINGQALMATFRDIGKDVFPTAMEAAMNMSTVFGQDLQSSVVQLGKALNDPITGLTALRRIGVSFSEQQKEQIKYFVETNQLARAQKIILDELGAEFGNAAKAMGQTAGGQADILQHKMANLKKELGYAIDSVMPAYLKIANSIVDTLIEWAAAMNANAKAFADWRAQIDDMTKKELTDAIAKQKELIKSYEDGAKPTREQLESTQALTREYRGATSGATSLLKAKTGLTVVLADEQKKLAELEKTLKEYDTAHKAAKKTTEDMVPAMETATKATEEFGKTWQEWVTNRFGYGYEMITDFGTRAGEVFPELTEMIDTLGKAVAGQQEAFTTTAEGIEKYKSQVVDLAKTFKEYAEPAIASAWEAIWTSSGDAVTKLKDAIKTFIADFLVILARQYAAIAAAFLITLQFGKAIKFLAASAALFAVSAVVRSLAKGGSFVTHGPELMMVGDNPSGRERVSVTPSEKGFSQQATVYLNITFGREIIKREIQALFTDGQLTVPAILIDRT